MNSLFLIPMFAVIVEGRCIFPSRWEGTWFQSGVQDPITFHGNNFSFKGACVESDGDKFLVKNKHGNCYRCVVIHERHPNLLQYKETYCDPYKDIQTMCASITGDALLFSMFRVEAKPISCPLSGSFTFSYNRGNGWCVTPVSRIESCTQDHRLLFRFYACHNVLGTESSVEELECVAKWKEGSTRYLVGKLHHKVATSDEDRYRCFVYEKLKDEDGRNGLAYLISQSGDATCNGLFSATEGSRTMRLTKVHQPSFKCSFPSWLLMHHKWHSLDYKKVYHFTHHNTSFRVTDEGSTRVDSRGFCYKTLEHAPNQVKVIVYLTEGCNSAYVCLMFLRRDDHVMELLTGQMSNNAEEACLPSNFEEFRVTTLITSVSSPRLCPHSGHWSVTGIEKGGESWFLSGLTGVPCQRSPRRLVIGCTNTDRLEIHQECEQAVSAYSCHGVWEENGLHYLIASPLSRSSTGARRYCFIYREAEKSLQLSTSTESCHSEKGLSSIARIYAFNVTHEGDCQDFASGNGSLSTLGASLLFFSLLILLLVNR